MSDKISEKAEQEKGSVSPAVPNSDLIEFAASQQKPKKPRRKARLSNPRDLNKNYYDIESQREAIKKLAVLMVENPTDTLIEISHKSGLTLPKVKDLMAHNNYLYAMRLLATGKFASFTPKALKSFEECLESANWEIRFKAAVKVLENERIIGPSKVDINVNDLRDQPIEKIDRIIEMGQKLMDQTILNAEVIS